MPFKTKLKVKRSLNYKEPAFHLPSLDYDEIPNLNDYVTLTNDELGIVKKLEYVYNGGYVIYTIQLVRNKRSLTKIPTLIFFLFF